MIDDMASIVESDLIWPLEASTHSKVTVSPDWICRTGGILYENVSKAALRGIDACCSPVVPSKMRLSSFNNRMDRYHRHCKITQKNIAGKLVFIDFERYKIR